MNILDLYIHSVSKFETTVPNAYNITNFEPISFEGVVTENIMYSILYNCHMTCVSKSLKNNNVINGIIIRPESSENVKYDFNTFIQLNFFDKKHVKKILKLENYYDIFESIKINALKLKFEGIIDRKDFKVEERFARFCKNMPSNYIVLNESEVDEYLGAYKIPKNVPENLPKNVPKNVPKLVEKSEKSSVKRIKCVLTDIGFGFGDFLQRYERNFVKFLAFSSTNFDIVRDKQLTYK